MDDPLGGSPFAHSFSGDPYSQGTYVETNGQTAMSGPHLVTQGAASTGVPAPDMENDKRTIYRHPLFPLLLMLFEKCELATQTTECPSARSIDMDIRAFVSQMQHQGKVLLVDEPEIDSLIVKAVEVLRMHLLELEKVGDLCKDFCQRYIACLKGKMQSDNILKAVPDQAFTTPPEQPTPPGAAFSVSSRGLPPTRDVGMSSSQGALSSLSAQLGDSQGVLSFEQQTTSSSTESTPSTSTSGQTGNLSAAGEIQHVSLARKGRRRGVLPKHATTVLRSWLFQHLVHPYPTEDEKRQLAVQTQLTILQVNNWFINARRRILQPMLDATANSNSRKSPITRYPVHHIWPSISDVRPSVLSPHFDGDDMGAAGVPVLAVTSLNSEPLVHPITDMPMQPMMGNIASLPLTPSTPVDPSVSNFMPESPLPGAAGFPVLPNSVQRTPCKMSYSSHGIAVKSSASVDGHYHMMNTLPLQHPPNEHDNSQGNYHYREESPVEQDYCSRIRLMPPPRAREKHPGPPTLTSVPQEARGHIVSQTSLN